MATTTATGIHGISLVCLPTQEQDKAIEFYESLGFAGGKLGACVQEDLRVPGADNDVAPELVADVLLHLLLGEGLPCLLNVYLAAQRYGHAPVGAVCHGATLAHAKDR